MGSRHALPPGPCMDIVKSFLKPHSTRHSFSGLRFRQIRRMWKTWPWCMQHRRQPQIVHQCLDLRRTRNVSSGAPGISALPVMILIFPMQCPNALGKAWLNIYTDHIPCFVWISKPGNPALGRLFQSARSFPSGCWKLWPPCTEAYQGVLSQMWESYWSSESLVLWWGRARQWPSLGRKMSVGRIWEQLDRKKRASFRPDSTSGPGSRRSITFWKFGTSCNIHKHWTWTSICGPLQCWLCATEKPAAKIKRRSKVFMIFLLRRTYSERTHMWQVGRVGERPIRTW